MKLTALFSAPFSPNPRLKLPLLAAFITGNRNLVKTAHLWPAKSRPFGQLSASSLKITRNVTQRQSSYTICGRVKTFKIVKGKLRKETLRSMVKTRTSVRKIVLGGPRL